MAQTGAEAEAVTGPPPPRDGSGRPLRRFRKPTVEVSDQRGVENVPTRNPAALLRSIPLPVHEVLTAPAPATHLQQAPDGVGGMTIKEARRRGCLRGRHQRGGGDRLELRDVEGGVHSECPGEFKANCHWIDDACDLEWANVTWGQFFGLHS